MNRSDAPPEPTNTESPPPPRSRPRIAAIAAVALLLTLTIGLWLLRGDARPDAAATPAVDAAVPAQALRPSGDLAVEGTLHDDLGQPLARAEIQVALLDRPEVPPWLVLTDPQGRFALSQLPREALLISAALEGHVSDEQTWRPGDPISLAFTLARQGELIVLLRDEPGQLLDGAEVVLTGPELWPPRMARADARGEVLFDGLAAGAYSARARKQQRIAAPSSLVTVTPGERTQQQLSMRLGERLTGTVVDSDSKQPLARVQVAVFDLTPGIGAVEAVSDAQGAFVLAGLWPVAVRVEFRRDGYARGIAELNLPHEDALPVALRGAVAISGRVVDERGKPLANTPVSLSSRDLQPLDLAPKPPHAADPSRDAGVGELGVTVGAIPTIPVRPIGDGWSLGELATYTDADGRFSIEGLPPVPLLLSASRRGFESATLELLELTPHSERTALELILRAAGSVAGRLVDARGEAVADAPVTAESKGALLTATTGSHGDFAFADVLGEVSISAAPAGFVSPHCRVTVHAGETARCDLRIDSPLFSLPVRVVDEYGFALAGAEVTASFTNVAARGEKTRGSVTRLSSEDGTATLGELPPPPYRLEVALPGYVVQALDVARAERELRVSLRRAATLAGVVLDSLGRPVPSAAVSSDEAELTESNASGAFTLSGVAPGALTLSASHPRAGSGKSAELRARPSETLSGLRIVLSGRYEPSADAGATSADDPASEESEAASKDTTFAQRGRAVIVARVRAGTPVARAGLEEGDVLEAIDGEAPLSAAHARGMLRGPGGKVANVRVQRDKRHLNLRYRRPPL